MRETYWDGSWSSTEIWVMGMVIGAVAQYAEWYDLEELEEEVSNGMFDGSLQFIEWAWLNGARQHGWQWK